MANDEEDMGRNSHGKRRTPSQIKVLDNFYSKEKYPSPTSMEDIASSLNLTYKQVRGWFIEKRRKDKRDNGTLLPPPPLTTYKKQTHHHRNKQTQKQKITGLQRILPPDFILKKVFRKDGPPLGSEFDPLPPGALFQCSTSAGPKSAPTCAGTQRVPKRRKVSKSLAIVSEVRTKKIAPVMKHGMGKGLMTVWRATHPGAGGLPTGLNLIGREVSGVHLNSTSVEPPGSLYQSMNRSQHAGSLCQKTKRSQHHRLVAKQQRRLGNKLPVKKNRAVKTKKVESTTGENSNKSHTAECKLDLEEVGSTEYSNALVALVDDEELELRELQAGPNPLRCSAHLASSGMHGCSLCKDLLARFPPHSVKMKQPMSMQPWGSSSELVKKLFKVFRFLYTHATTIAICPFTLDEFAQAFHDQDSLLLGKIHMSLLKLLLSDVEIELSNGCLPHASKEYRFLDFLHAVKSEVFILKIWNSSLNPLTWTEILRQVLVAAGFSSKQSAFRHESINKEESRMVEHGLCPGTLKGALFSILSEEGNNGLKVSEMAKSIRVLELNLMKTSEELELLICSTLSSDITLFEKISPSAYRLRINPLITKGGGNLQSDSEDSEDSGSVDDDSADSITESSSDESELASESASLALVVKHKRRHKRKNSVLLEYTEIDESHPGEVWALGLMEGEYSDLSIEEKLNALVALVDLTNAVSSIRMEDPVRVATECISSIQHHGGGKIKRSVVKRTPLDLLPIKSSAPSRCRKANITTKKTTFNEGNGSKENDANTIEEGMAYGHPLRSICLGSDRRFNSYWLFLGPCNGEDPGHRRIYFESSEDGHWEVIDTREALCDLLSVLDGRGMREARLLASLVKREAFLCEAMSNGLSEATQCNQSSSDIVSNDGSSPLSDVDNNLSHNDTANDSLASSAISLELGKKGEEQKRRWDRLQAFDVWLWKSFYSNLNAVKLSSRSYHDSLARCGICHDLYWRDEKHCKICHTTFELDFDLEEKYAIHVATCREKDGNEMFPKHKVLSSQLQSLKAALHAVEAAMPKEALANAWTTSGHKLWVMRLKRTSSLPEFLQVLTDFVGAINVEWLRQCGNMFGSSSALDDIVVFFPTIPQTTTAVALWLVKLDSLIAPHLERVHNDKTKERNTRQKVRRS